MFYIPFFMVLVSEVCRRFNSVTIWCRFSQI